MFGTASGLFQNHMQPIIEETFCKPAGFPFKQITPSCSPLRSPMLLPWKFPCVPRLFSSPEECKVFLFKQKFAAWSWANKQQPLAQDSLFLSCPLQSMHLLAREVFLRERRTLGKYQNCWGPGLYKIPAKIKRSPWLPCSWPSVLQSK